jgi:hypothetical protein
MKNLDLALWGDILTITVDLSVTVGPSNSGKTVIIATTEGIVPLPGRKEQIGINVFKYEKSKAK